MPSLRGYDVAALASTLAVGGAERALQTLARGLKLRGYNLRFYCLRQRGEVGSELERERFAVADRLLIRPGEWRRSANDLRRADLILALDHNNVITALRYFMRCLPPVVVWFHLQGPPPRSWWPALTRVAAVAAVATSQKRFLLEAVTPEKIAVIPNGVAIPPVTAAATRASAKNALGLPPDRVVVVMVGRLSREKGGDVLLKAAAAIAARERPLFLIVGDGPERAGLESTARATLRPGDYLFLGERRDVTPAYYAADILALPSRQESTPMALLEGMAHGLPAVAARVGDVTEILSGDTGVTFAAEDAGALAKELARLSRDARARQEMGDAARVTVSSRYGLSAMLDGYESLFASVIANKDLNNDA